MRRLEGATSAPYLFAAFVAACPLFWIFFYNAGLPPNLEYLFAFIMTFASFLGAYFGHRAGLKAQITFKAQVIEFLRKSGQLPEEFDEPTHDHPQK